MSVPSSLRTLLFKNPKDLPAVPRYLIRSVQFLISSWTEYVRHHGPIRASGLAYSTLLALVPLVVVVFSFFSAFGGLETIRSELQSLVLNILVPTQQDEILKYMNQFLGNAETLGLVGFLSFALTSIFLLANIERNFNDVWGAHTERRITQTMMVYTSVLVFGTLLISVSFLLTSWITGFLNNLGIEQITALQSLFVRIFPTLAMLGALVLMIMQIPSAKVRLSSAFVGATIGAVLWEAAKMVFSTWAGSSVRNSIIYGSLALIPIFLLWLYVAWNIILFALSASYVHQNILRSSADPFIPIHSPFERLLVGLSLFYRIADSFHHGKEIPEIRDLSNEYLISPAEIESMIKLFIDNKLLLPVEGQKSCYVPARSLDSIKLTQIASLITGDVSEDMKRHLGDERHLISIVLNFSGKAFETLNNLSIADIVSGNAPPDEQDM